MSRCGHSSSSTAMDVRLLYFLVSELLVVTANTNVTGMANWDSQIPGIFRVVGGKSARLGQFPHQALVIANHPSVFCGGSLISQTAVLTAAHCTVDYKSWTIRLGGIYRSQYEKTALIQESVWGVAHPDFDVYAGWSHDVAVLFLPNKATLGNYIKLVALPSAYEVYETFVGQNAMISGWGKTSDYSGLAERLQWAEVTVISNEMCELFFEQGIVIESTLCAGTEYTNRCLGDGGTALVLKTEQGYKQIGIANHIPMLCEVPEPATYARVTYFLDWIKRTANIK